MPEDRRSSTYLLVATGKVRSAIVQPLQTVTIETLQCCRYHLEQFNRTSEMTSCDGIRVAIGTNALGKPGAGHDIGTKLEAAKRQGFQGVEVAIECLEAHSNTDDFSNNSMGREERLKAAASDIHKRARAFDLQIVALNPFGAYDGLVEEEDIVSRLQEGKLWIELCNALHAPILQIASCIYPLHKSKRLTPDIPKIAANMRRLGELAHLHGITVAFEAVAWGIHLHKWQHIRAVLAEVRLPNVQYCLDTFHIAAVEAGDPFNKEKPVRDDGHKRLERSLEDLRKTVRAGEIGYFQLSDAIAADKEQKGYPVRDLEQPPFMTQSRNCRVFPGEGSLPVLPVAKAVFDTGYRGWVSMEVFHPDLWSKEKT